jgi:hypothetical protein
MVNLTSVYKTNILVTLQHVYVNAVISTHTATYCPIFLSWLPDDVTLPVLRRRIATAEFWLPEDPVQHRH